MISSGWFLGTAWSDMHSLYPSRNALNEVYCMCEWATVPHNKTRIVLGHFSQILSHHVDRNLKITLKYSYSVKVVCFDWFSYFISLLKSIWLSACVWAGSDCWCNVILPAFWIINGQDTHWPLYTDLLSLLSLSPVFSPHSVSSFVWNLTPSFLKQTFSC